MKNFIEELDKVVLFLDELNVDLEHWPKFEEFMSMYEFGDSEPYFVKKFTDQKAVKCWVKRYGNTTEMMEQENLRLRRNDIPDVVAFWEQGSERNNELLDDSDTYIRIRDRVVSRKVGTMNDRDFRERCTVVGNNLQAVYIKDHIDDLRVVHEPEWMAEQLNCEYIDAVTICESFKRLGIDRRMSFKLINGYWDSREEMWRNGLKNIGADGGGRFARYFESLIGEVDDIDEFELSRSHFYEVSQGMIDSGDWCLQYGINKPYWGDQMRFIEEMLQAFYGNILTFNNRVSIRHSRLI